MRSRAGFRVSLKSERRFPLETDPLQRAIEERAVSRLEIARQTAFVDRETVVLAGDENPTSLEILDWMISAMVTEFHLGRAGAAGERE